VAAGLPPQADRQSRMLVYRMNLRRADKSRWCIIPS
jgi:hypothetical protein